MAHPSRKRARYWVLRSLYAIVPTYVASIDPWRLVTTRGEAERYTSKRKASQAAVEAERYGHSTAPEDVR